MKKDILVIANWKRYIEDSKEAVIFAKGLRRKSRLIGDLRIMLAPAHPFLSVVGAALKGSNITLAAQTLSGQRGAAQTGEVSGMMLLHIGASAVIVGHSERRALGESKDLIREEVSQASAAGLTTILCIGERERDIGGTYLATIAEQLRSALLGLPSKTKLMIAYEPVWAIGKSAKDAMQPQELTEMVIFIKKTLADILERRAALRVPILYGGSVEAENVPGLLHDTGINGFLVGHASASLDSFISLLLACK